jgi:hypothetical protein
MYHPGVTEQSLATRLTMSGVDVAGFDLVLHPVSASTIDVSLDWGKRPRGDAELQVVDLTDTPDDYDVMFGSPAFVAARRFKKTVPAAATRISVHGITAGRYLLIASATEPNTNGSGVKKLWARQEVRSDGLIPVSISLGPSTRPFA